MTWLLQVLDAVDAETLRRCAAYLLIAATVGAPVAHASIQLIGQGTLFNHIMVFMSAFAIWLSAAVLIISTDLETK